MTKYFFGREELEKKLIRCGCKRTPRKDPLHFPPLTPKEFAKCAPGVQSKARRLGCADALFKGVLCQVCKTSQKIRDDNKRNGWKQQFDNGEDICPNCGKDAPGIHNLDNRQGERPVCTQRCRKRLRTVPAKAREKRLELENEEINEETHKICMYGGHGAVLKEKFVRYEVQRGIIRIRDDINSFENCRDCAMKISQSKRIMYIKSKLEQSEEILQRLAEEQEKLRLSAAEQEESESINTKGCCATCCCDLNAWHNYCDGRTEGGVGEPETLPIRKKSLANDWDHPDRERKWKNVCDILSKESRAKEINGPPRLDLPCVACHNIKTWLKCENQPTGREVATRRYKTRSLLKLVTKLKWEKWQKQGNKCGNPECPMDSSLKRGLERIKASRTMYDTQKSPEEIFMMFYTQYEHTDAMLKLFTLSQATKVSDEEVREEADKCTVHCVFCARLKTMESGDTTPWQIVALSESDIESIWNWDDDADDDMEILYTFT